MNGIKGKKIVVIGGNGRMGSAVVGGLVKRNSDVVIFSRHARASHLGVTAVQGSITDVAALREVLKSAVGAVISVEANWTAPGMEETYVKGTRTVLEAIGPDIHIVFMGNIGVTDVLRMPEYNTAKLRAEELIRSSGNPYTIIRPAWLVSDNEGAGVELEQGDKYTGRRDDVTVGNLSAAFAAVFEYPGESIGKTFELYGGDNKSPDWQEALSQLKPDKR